MGDHNCPACTESFNTEDGLEAHCYFQHRGKEPEDL